MGLDEAIGQLDKILGKVESMCGDAAPPMRINPDDPWAAEMEFSMSVTKRRCGDCGNLLTLPFERHCPMPGCFVPELAYLKLKPVMGPVEGAAKPAAKEGKGKEGKGKEGGGGGDGGAPPAAGPQEGGGKKDKKEKKKKGGEGAEAGGEAKPAAPKSGPAPASPAENYDKTCLKVGKVVECEPHPNSDKLYITKVDVGTEQRQVVAGLQKFIPQADLQGRMVCVVCNLKPAKLAGTPSEAMILAADTPDPSHPEGRGVKTIVPPAGSEPGDRIYYEGSTPSEAPPKAMSSKVWEKVVPLLSVKGGHATFDGKTMITAKGGITSEMPDGSGIH